MSKHKKLALLALGLIPLLSGCFKWDYGLDVVAFGAPGARFASVRDQDPPGQPNNVQGREVAWNDLVALCDTPATRFPDGSPGYGIVGWGGFSPPTAACVSEYQANITDDPANTDPNEAMTYICQDGRDCQPGGTGAVLGGDLNTWFRGLMTDPAKVTQLIYGVRDYYTPVTDPVGGSGPEAFCIAITDYPQPDVDGLYVSRRLACP